MVTDRSLVTLRHLQVALVASMCIIGALGLKSAFVSWGFAPVVIVAGIFGAIVPVLAHRFGLEFPVSTVVSLLSLLVVGTVLTYQAPWLIGDFVLDLVESWRRILTIAAPVDPQSSLVAVPIITAWIGSTIGTECALRTSSIGLPLVGPILAVAVGILFGLNDTGISLVVGLIVFVLAFGLIALRSRTHWMWTTEAGAEHRGRRLTVAAVLVATAVAAAPFLADRGFGIAEEDRFTLRQQVDPPFDLTRLASPLAELKGSLPTADMVESGDRGEVAFRVAGDAIERFRLSVLDDYDGSIWLINRNADGADFIRAGTQFPPPDAINQGPSVKHTVEIVGLRESWLPTAGTAVGLELTSDVTIGGVAPIELIRLDRVTGNLLIRPRLRSVEGLTYNIESVAPTEAVSIDTDRTSSMSVLTSSRNVRVPEVPAGISSLARDAMAGEDAPFDRVLALQKVLGEQVYDSEARPGHLMVQLATIASRQPMVGFDEQYAALMSTTLRSAGIPARVAVGFVPGELELARLADGETVAIYETDIEAWVEVPFEGVGWVAFDAGPPDTQTDDVEDGATEGQAESVSANPPPPVVSTTTTTIPEAEEEEEDEEPQESSRGVPAFVLAIGLAIGFPILLFGTFVALVAWLKLRRKSRRLRAETSSARVHGAYQELLDRSVDVGGSIAPSITPRRAIESIAHETFDPTVRSGMLVTLVEDAAFAPEEPSDIAVKEAWNHSDELASRLTAELSILDRTRALISLRSLRQGRRSG